MNISVIIPIHEYNDELSLFLDKAVESVFKQQRQTELPQVVLVYPADLNDAIVGFRDGMIRKNQNSGTTFNIYFIFADVLKF